MSVSIGSKVGILLEVLAHLTGPEDRVRRGFPESRFIAPLGGSLREIRDTWGVTKEEVTGVVPESWLEWSLGAEGDAAPRPPEVDILAAYDAVTTTSWKARDKLGKLVNQGRHAAHTASLNLLPETARSPGPDDPLGGRETKTLAKARYGSLQGAGTTSCLRGRPTDSLQVIPVTKFMVWAMEGVSWRLRSMWQ